MGLKILYYLLMAASLLALLINRRRLDRRLHLFIPLLVLALLTEATQDVLGGNHWSYRAFFSIYTPVEYTILALIIRSYLIQPGIRKAILISVPLFIIASAIVQIWIKKDDLFYTYLDTFLEAPLLCTWTLFYFFHLAAESSRFYLRANPMFVISVANLIFYSASIFSYSFGGYLQQAGYPKLYFMKVYSIGQYLNLFLYSVYLFAFSVCRMRKS